jgi:Rhs element Vgr protein
MANITAKSPLKRQVDLISFDILIDGNSMSDGYSVQYIEVTRELNKIASAEFAILDGNRATEEFEAQDSGSFAPGHAVKINAGYHQENETIFEGIVVKTGIKIDNKRHPMLVVYCVDKSVKMTINRRTKYYLDVKDSDVMNELAGNYGLEKDIENTTVSHKELVQYHVTDWDFLLSRAEANGMVVLTENNKVLVQKPDVSGSADVILTMGTDIVRTSLYMDSRSQMKNVECKAWDMSNLAVVSSSSSEPSVNSQGSVTGSSLADSVTGDDHLLHSIGPLPTDELKDWADATLLKARLARIRGTVECQGTADLKPNAVITLQGVGDYFNGDAYVSRVEHKIKAGNWVSIVGVGLNPQWFIESVDNIQVRPAGGILPGIDGLYYGLVKQIHEDPDGETRIQIEVPTFGDDTAIWARLSNLYATGDAGSFFMPEVGDEVVMGFANGDPRFPVVLGMMYSKKKQPPYTPDDKNSVKAIVTNNQLKIIFEDENKNIIIETPGGNKVTISDENKSITIEDQNSNKMEMSESGITMDSPKDISITAQGKISLEATQDISVKSSMKVGVEGLNVENKADVGFTAQGTTAELKGSAQTTVKGGIVMIN